MSTSKTFHGPVNDASSRTDDIGIFAAMVQSDDARRTEIRNTHLYMAQVDSANGPAEKMGTC